MIANQIHVKIMVYASMKSQDFDAIVKIQVTQGPCVRTMKMSAKRSPIYA